MNGWAVALLVALAAGVWIEVQNGRLNDLAARVHKAEALVAGYEAQRENERKHDAIDKELRNGGEDSLSDYLRGAADKLWPAP